MKKVQKDRTHATRNVYMKSLALIIGLVCLLTTPSHAIWLGQSQINPYLEVQGIYESNIYRTNDNEETDFITVISPGIHMEFPTADDAPYRFLANYRANIKIYGNDGDSKIDPNGELNTVQHRLDSQAQMNFAAGLKLAAGYALDITSNPPDSAGDTRDEFKEHQIMAQASYAFVDRYELQVRYDGIFRRYDEASNQVDDTTIHGVGATLFYRIFPSLSILGGGGYAKITRESPFSDSTEYQGYGGVRFEATARTTGTVKAGVMTKNFDQASLDDSTTVYVSGDVDIKFSEDTNLTLNANRMFHDTSLSDESTASGAYYITTGFGASIAHKLAMLPNLSLTGSVGYQKEEYPKDANDRSDDNLQFGVGAEYKFLKYLTIGVKYMYSTNDSNVNSYDYTDNIVIGSIRAIL